MNRSWVMLFAPRVIKIFEAVAIPLNGVATASFLLAGLALGSMLHGTIVAAQPPEADCECRIASTFVLPAKLLTPEDPELPGDRAVRVGGISDLSTVSRHSSDGNVVLKAITDRGPTQKQSTPSGKRRVFLNPAYGPSRLTIVLPPLSVFSEGATSDLSEAEIAAIHGISTTTGVTVSGRANGLPDDEQIAGPSGGQLRPDPNGIDAEGLVECADGSCWISEEYRPSLLQCDGIGRVIARYVPEGTVLPGADTKVVANLPGHYAKRQNNRGFEAIAISLDETLIWVSLQSPLGWPAEDAAKTTGNIRMLVFDAKGCQPVAEYIYRLGDPADPAYRITGTSPDDGKVCAMAMVDERSLIVLEQSDAGDARLYRCRWHRATNTLDDPRALEPIGDLESLGISCLEKTLVADLGPLLAGMAADITAGRWRPGPDEPVAGLKLEGMAILNQKLVAICNDNDFDMGHFEDQNQPMRRSCLWIIALDAPLADASDAP